MARFQMKTSNRPQTIAEVKSTVDIDSFRNNPEWYEITEETSDIPRQDLTVKTIRNRTKVKDTK